MGPVLDNSDAFIMNIYFIGEKDKEGKLPELLEQHGTYKYLYSGNDILKYTELVEDTEEKILVVAPASIGWNLPIEFLQKVSNLRGIVTRSSWKDYIDLSFCELKDISVMNTPGVNARAVAEYAIFQMLSLVKRLPMQIENNLSVAVSKDSIAEEVYGKTVGVIGLGRIGTIIANICDGLGMEVRYWNRSVKDVKYDAIPLEKLLSESDIIFDCLEIKDETKDILNMGNCKQIKDSTYFISVLGGLGWTGDFEFYLLERAERGQLAGFSIENEHHKDVKSKIKDNYSGNVFIPAALAWYTKEVQERYDFAVAEKVKEMVANL